MQQSLETQINTALEQDARTAHAVIDVAALGGQATLAGAVRAADEKAAAVEVAKQILGVMSVVDELLIRPDATRTCPTPRARERERGLCRVI